MRTRHGDLDVFAVDQTAGGPVSYEALRGRAVAVEALGARILIAHPEDLIRMKTAASSLRDRPKAKRRQDLDDIVVLKRMRAQLDATTATELGRALNDPAASRGPSTDTDRPQNRERPQPPRKRRVLAGDPVVVSSVARLSWAIVSAFAVNQTSKGGVVVEVRRRALLPQPPQARDDLLRRRIVSSALQ